MSKFVMIEHSLRSVGGHYFEYARGISEAAQGDGGEFSLVSISGMEKLEKGR